MVSGVSVLVMMAVVVAPTVCSLVVWVPSSRMVVTMVCVFPFVLVAGLVVGYGCDFLDGFG